jgi:isopenicillin N synthase-like dioxygenase
MIVTKHAKDRYCDRVHKDSTDFLVKTVAQEAYENGKMPIQLYDTDEKLFKQLQKAQDRFFSQKKEHKTIVRLLQDVIFIFIRERNQIKFITCYKVNDEELK